MFSYDVDYCSDFDEVNDVSEWEQQCCLNPYDSGSNFGMEPCDVNDESDDLRSGEVPITGVFSSNRSTPYSGFEREGSHSLTYSHEASQRYLGQPTPHFVAPQGTNYNYNSESQFNFGYYYDDESCSMRCGAFWDEFDDYVAYGNSYAWNSANAEVTADLDEHKLDIECVVSTRSSADSCVKNNVDCDDMFGYSPWSHYYDQRPVAANPMHECRDNLKVDYAGMRGYTEHVVDVEYTVHLDGCGNIERVGYGQYCQTDFCQSPSMRNTTAQSDFGAKLELLVKEHELSVREHQLCVKENEIIRKDLASLRQKLDRLMGEEKCEQLAASLPCLESEKLLDNVFVMGEQQKEGLEQDENNMVVESSHGNEEQTEQSVGLKNAMRCLELQRKFWGIGSLLSVIPAAPIVQIIDPFLAEFELKSQYQLLKIESLDLNSMRTSKEQDFLGMRRSNLRFAAWAEWFRAKEADVILYDWFGIWRPPDSVFQYRRLGSNMVDFWFDKGRPPDGTTSFFVSTAQLRGRSPLKRDGLMYSQKLKDLIENVKSCRDLRGSDLLVNSFRLRTYFNYMFYSLYCKVYIRET